MNVSVTRRNFLKTAGKSSPRQPLYQQVPLEARSRTRLGTALASPRVELLRRADFVSARFGAKDVVGVLDYFHSGALTLSRVFVFLRRPHQRSPDGELPIRVTNSGRDLTYLHIRWDGKDSEGFPFDRRSLGSEVMGILNGAERSPSG